MAKGGSLGSGYGARGFEFAAGTAGFALVGYWVGGKLGDAALGAGIGAVLGIVGGMYNLIRLSLKASRKAQATRGKSEK